MKMFQQTFLHFAEATDHILICAGVESEGEGELALARTVLSRCRARVDTSST